ncbi:hypothetical protein LOC68_27315 [Blastopirellula sp. JC732]|uniref:Uncharacterized protein n=1 Tax=Blastopirellula sediminis TaxID=2894196 RepID=A0A9X1MSM4_9BACT|nr:hypothetical protein [Blastopirellula sediminis]MCC9604580.1 hypothetical protein [Blastopirellula sediminis]MCC9632121.1 hypothetical protein [Blastopirellula sediminis]
MTFGNIAAEATLQAIDNIGQKDSASGAILGNKLAGFWKIRRSGEFNAMFSMHVAPLRVRITLSNVPFLGKNSMSEGFKST